MVDSRSVGGKKRAEAHIGDWFKTGEEKRGMKGEVAQFVGATTEGQKKKKE